MNYPNRLKAVWNAVNQVFAALITGWPDATISSWAFVWDRDGKRSWPRRCIDTLFFWEKHHCLIAYLVEYKSMQRPTVMATPPPEDEMDEFEKTYGYRIV